MSLLYAPQRVMLSIWFDEFIASIFVGLLILRTYAMWNCNRNIFYGHLVFASVRVIQ